MRDPKLMERAVKNKDVIFNCAAQSSHPLSFRDPFFDVDVNCSGNITLLEAVRRKNKKALVIYTSSSTVIGKALNEVVDETHGEFPLDIYSANKGVAEKYYYIYNKVYDLKTVVLRFANLYGPYGKAYPDFGFINYFISQAASGKPVTIYGDGSQTRNVMFVEDAAELLYRCVSKPELTGNLYFAVHREHYSVKKIAAEIARVFGGGRVKSIKWPDIRKRIEIRDVIISGAKLFYILQWEPKYDLTSGLEKTRMIMQGRYRAKKIKRRAR